jgi:hypothetical protein
LSGTGQVSATVSIASGEVASINGTECTTCSLNIDFGFVLDGSLRLTGTVFFDNSGSAETDEVFTVGDAPYGSIVVYLYDDTRTLRGTTTTDANGRYRFTNLTGDSVYTVSVDANPLQLHGTDLTAVGDYELETYHTVTMTTTNVGEVDFGFYQAIDFGHLPASYGTTVSVEGAVHISGTFFLGTALDTAGDGQPGSTASDDDQSDPDDEDCVQRRSTNRNRGSTQTLDVTVTGDNGHLVYFVDFNADADFTDSDESIVYGEIGPGTGAIDITIPSDFNPDNDLYARFHLYDSTQLTSYSPTVLTTNGEVEDHGCPVDGNPTAVTQAAFDAETRDGTVLVEWETVSEIDHLGFKLHRSRTSDGPYKQVNDTLIAARGAPLGPATPGSVRSSNPTRPTTTDWRMWGPLA